MITSAWAHCLEMVRRPPLHGYIFFAILAMVSLGPKNLVNLRRHRKSHSTSHEGLLHCTSKGEPRSDPMWKAQVSKVKVGCPVLPAEAKMSRCKTTVRKYPHISGSLQPESIPFRCLHPS
jgi:hypothetical protein